MNEMEILDYFGKILMKEVRDWAIYECDSAVSAVGGSQSVRRLLGKDRKLSEDERELLHAAIPDVVDKVLHYMMFMLEQYPEFELMVEGENLNDISDGLAGELYTEEGWSMRFSKERHEEPSLPD